MQILHAIACVCVCCHFSLSRSLSSVWSRFLLNIWLLHTALECVYSVHDFALNRLLCAWNKSLTSRLFSLIGFLDSLYVVCAVFKIYIQTHTKLLASRVHLVRLDSIFVTFEIFGCCMCVPASSLKSLKTLARIAHYKTMLTSLCFNNRCLLHSLSISGNPFSIRKCCTQFYGFIN